MLNIPFHIAYLLINHDCVIVQGLGAFVVSPSDKRNIDREKILSPPGNILRFDPEIKQNDDLLVNSIIKEKKCSYKAASASINHYVSQVLDALHKGKNVRMPWVGTLHLKDNKILFRPEKTLSCNAFNYGLTDFSLPYLKDIQPEANNISPNKINTNTEGIGTSKKLLVYIGSIASVLAVIGLALFFLNKSYTDKNSAPFDPDKIQSANLNQLLAQDTTHEKISSTDTAILMPSDTVVTTTKDTTVASSNTIVTPKDTAVAPSKTVATPKDIAVAPSKTTVTPKDTIKANTEAIGSDKGDYFLIITSFADKDLADKTLENIKSKGFKNAGEISSDGRNLIYISRFEDESKAAKFLIQFKEDYPNYAPWLLKRTE